MIETHPQSGRLTMSATEAARVLRRDIRTVRRMIETGEIAGGAQQGPKQRRWYVYVDQLPMQRGGKTRRSVEQLAAEVVGLRADNAELHAKTSDLITRVVSSDETNRLVMAARTTLRESMDDYQSATSQLIRAASCFRRAVDHFYSAVEEMQEANGRLNAVLSQQT
ncbi:helix-turn-helix domain-containing protein [Mycobacterium spongiae]|uniref:Helix-turn-helix domain-containing protein n=1 Tax=Mycobacterium spongiae TaxID=886343 RepID=A0A975JZY8_9MYCO|nr:helix-turn-helix domain-containing protein [Mycobacterium spongiae]QUR68405.1 hypothetical protein F6B93_16150 [Mycobacterium spongiae]